ncbi:MAG: hypothetical protein EPO58_09300 [Chitinophagaceae bacterium]|nr:MAG: hypothetical protein EPO58_09300 [Chitinophagaceae bacterium]
MKTQSLLLFIMLLGLISFSAIASRPERSSITKVSSSKLLFKKNIKSVEFTRDLIGYIFLLHNDGCYYLGRLFLADNGTLEWYNLNGDPTYVGTTVFCMSAETFSNFC